MNATRIASIVVAALLMAGCGQGSTATSSSAPNASTAPVATVTPVTTATPNLASTTAPASASDPGRTVCRISDGSGFYYRLVISESEHNLSACNGGATFAGTIDDLLNLPGMDRRCVADNNPAIARFHAFVAVYSDNGSADLAAANAFCQQIGATMG